MHMHNLNYILLLFFIGLIIYEFSRKTSSLYEGLENNDDVLWKENLHNINYLSTQFDSLESLDDIRKNNPALLGEHANDKNIKINNVVSYFKSGVEDNEKSIQAIATKLKNALPKAKDIHISGV
mgnify:FL=1|tara:strand:- start:284 stop:655 length:372 start_codon:yes stop_codon:yes gene_type:complete